MIWLPKAHADSSISGSILLAATILKLAMYRYLRVLIHFLPDATHYFSPVVQTIAIITLIYASFSTIIQQDTKRFWLDHTLVHKWRCWGSHPNGIFCVFGSCVACYFCISPIDTRFAQVCPRCHVSIDCWIG